MSDRNLCEYSQTLVDVQSSQLFFIHTVSAVPL